MKRILACLFALALAAAAANVTLTWDPNPPSEDVEVYRLYEVVDGTNTLVAEVDGATNVVTVPNVTPGRHEYVLTAVNIWGESDASDPAITPSPATAPKTFKVTLVITVE